MDRGDQTESSLGLSTPTLLSMEVSSVLCEVHDLNDHGSRYSDPDLRWCDHGVGALAVSVSQWLGWYVLPRGLRV